MIKNVVIIALLIVMVIITWKFLKSMIIALVGLGVFVLIVYLVYTWRK